MDFPAASMCALDRRGKYCAVYVSWSFIELWDLTSIPISMALLPFPPSFGEYLQPRNDFRWCSQLVWSHDANEIIGIFGNGNKLKRKGPPTAQVVSTSRYIVVWDVTSTTTARIFKIPFGVSTAIALPSHPSSPRNQFYLLGTVETGTLIVFDSFEGTCNQLLMTSPQCISSYQMDANNSQPDGPIVSDNLTASNSDSNREMFVDIDRMVRLEVIFSATSDSNPNYDDRSGAHSREELLAQWTNSATNQPASALLSRCSCCCSHCNSPLSHSLFYTENDPFSGLARTLHSISLSFSPATSSSSSLLISSLRFQVLHSLALNWKSGRVAHACMDSISSRIALLAAEDSRSLCLLRVNAASGRLEELPQSVGVASFFIGSVSGAGFLCGSTSPAANRGSEDVLVVALGECIPRLATTQYQHKLLLWHSQLDKFLPSTGYSSRDRKGMLPHCLSMPAGGLQTLSFRPADSSLDPTHPPDGGMLDNMAMVFGVDKHGGLWSLQSQIQSDFPGPMYPIGFRLIQKVESYLEAEDELDTVRRSPMAADNDEEVCAEKAGREADAAVDDAANATKKSTEDFISISLQSPGRQCGYLQQWWRRTRRRCSPHSSATSWLFRPRSSPATSSPSSVESAASARRPSAQQRIKSWLEPRWKECGRRPWSRR